MKWEALNLADGAISIRADAHEVAILSPGKITALTLEKLLNRMAEHEHEDDPDPDDRESEISFL